MSSSDDESESVEFGSNSLFTFFTSKHLCESGVTNFVISPIFVEAMMVMVLLAADGETAAEIESNLDCLVCKTDIIGAEITKSLSKLFYSPNHILININKFYFKENFQIKEEFKVLAETITGVDMENIDLRHPNAVKAINKWVEDQTGGKIRNLIEAEDLDDSANCILINTVYAKIDWDSQFLKQLTHDNKFYKSEDEVITVKTMMGRFVVKYHDCVDLNVRLIEKELKSGASMVIVLPNEKQGLSELDKKIDVIFKMDTKSFETELVDLRLPKFKIETKIDYREVFEKRGIKRVFKEHEADLYGIAEGGTNLYINSIVQKISIEINEEGLEVNPPEDGELPFMCVMFPPIHTVKFVVDHPFAFFIKMDGKIIFAGKVVDPSATTDNKTSEKSEDAA